MSLKPGLVWTPGDKGKFRPFEDFRQIIKGKHKGMVEVVLPARPARKIIVHPESIKRYPVRTVEVSNE
jgi:hypothetical protein